MRKLVPLSPDTRLDAFEESDAREAVLMTVRYYGVIGYNPPWISYLLEYGGQTVGICSFKGTPADKTVEIAYYTFPAYEGGGHASFMCRELVGIAAGHDESLTITARTLPEDNASTSVLKKNGFELVGLVTDPEDGEVFEWRYAGQ